ncbi:zinc-binding dehydrogenase [Dactylosporangium darangshiense]|uniref:zinc-binding dehydrogenase n=1 Tax=Dactylosporangium darangshiense TaxID=579108 RepID=UPI0036263EC1
MDRQAGRRPHRPRRRRIRHPCPGRRRRPRRRARRRRGGRRRRGAARRRHGAGAARHRADQPRRPGAGDRGRRRHGRDPRPARQGRGRDGGGRGAGAAKLERLRQLGADQVVDYSEPGWTAAVEPVDAVLDGAGGEYGRAAFDLVKRGGRFSGHGTPAGGFAVADPELARARDVTATGIEQVQLSPQTYRGYLGSALAALETKRFVPLIGQVYALDDAAEAHRAIEERTAVGKTLPNSRMTRPSAAP